MVNIMKINGNVLTETKQVKANARKALATYVANNRSIFETAVKNENGTYSIAVADEANNTVYINFEVTVSTLNASDRAKRKSRAKTEKATENYDID